MSEKSSRRGKLFMILFALPFCAVGVITATRALLMILTGVSDWSEFLIFVVFALVFGGMGFGMLWITHYGSRLAGEEERLRKTYPDEPWMWRRDWAHNRITGSGKRNLVLSWIIASIWNIVSWVLIITSHEEIMRGGSRFIILALLFPIIGLGFFIWAVRATIRWRKFGVSTLTLSTLPGKIGGELRGSIHTGMNALPGGGVVLTLTCIKKVRRNRRDSTDSEEILWQEEEAVPREQLYRSPHGLSIPFEISISPDCPETSEGDGRMEILWQLHARAEVSGVDYNTTFPVPVLRTSESSSPVAEEAHPPGFSPRQADEFDPKRATILVTATSAGGTEFYFGPLRNPGVALGMFLFLAIWTGAIWLMTRLGAPKFLPIIFGLFGVLMAAFLVFIAAGTTRAVIGEGLFRIHRGFFGATVRTIEVKCSHIDDVKIRIAFQQTPGIGFAGKAFYTIDIHRKDGSKIAARRYVKNKREAEWLAREMKRRVLEATSL